MKDNIQRFLSSTEHRSLNKSNKNMYQKFLLNFPKFNSFRKYFQRTNSGYFLLTWIF